MQVEPSRDVEIAQRDDEGDLLPSLTLAFVTDPLLRWLYPSPRDYLEHGTKFLEILGSQSYEYGTGYCLANRGGGAFWLPPGVEPGGPTRELFESTLSEATRDELLAAFDRVTAVEPTGSYWMLRLVGIEPGCQGMGYGSGLLEPVLAECDDSGERAYLLSSNPRNLSFYRRHGFEVLEEVQVGSVPPFYPMLREPQP